jgi:hypothetical protein
VGENLEEKRLQPLFATFKLECLSITHKLNPLALCRKLLINASRTAYAQLQLFRAAASHQFITQKEGELAMHRLNHRSRKCLGYRTPHEVFMEQLQLHNQSVALQT